MANNTRDTIRVVTYREGDSWVAQCLEHDIAIQAPDLESAMQRIDFAVNAECEYTMREFGEEFKGIGPAPQQFIDMFDAYPTRVSAQGMEMKIAA